MKVVVNKCFGGFGLSYQARKMYCERTKMKFDDFCFWDINRADKDLIAIVEYLGNLANDMFSELEVVEIPDDIQWEINDYDGYETIHEAHRSW